MKIHIAEKYTFVYDDKGEQLQYFESFEVSHEKNKVIRIETQDWKGERFVRDMYLDPLKAKVRWFGGRYVDMQVMFVRNARGNAFDYLILIH